MNKEASRLIFLALLYSFSIFISELDVANAQDNRVWAISITGGGEIKDTSVDFHEVAKQFHETYKALGVKDDQLFEYFGQDDETQCYSRKKQSVIEQIDKSIKAFNADPTNCAKAEPIFKSWSAAVPQETICTKSPEKGFIKKNLADLDDDKKNDIKGPATKENFHGVLATITKSVKKGDHLYFSLRDHGFKLSSSWLIQLGDGAGVNITTLRKLFDKLNEIGVVIHLDVQACYSGGFTQGLTKTTGSAVVCSTASTDPNFLGYGSVDTFDYLYPQDFRTYGNQLSAFACSFAKDYDNRPYSSLDTVVERWEQKQQKNEVTIPTCDAVKDLKSLDEQVKEFSKIIDSTESLAKERRELLDAYQESFASVAKKCAKDRSKGVKFNKDLSACVDKTKSLDDSIEQSIKESLNVELGEKYNIQMINRHLRFLKNADAAALNEFRKTFCCLSFEPKSGKMHKMCKSDQ